MALSKKIIVEAQTTPDLDYQVDFTSSSEDISLTNLTNQSAYLSSTVEALKDQEVEVTASVDEDVVSDPLNLSLINVTEFKYDLLTYTYDTDAITLEREINGTDISVSVTPTSTIEASESDQYRLFDVMYPVTIAISLSLAEEGFRVVKIEDQPVYAIIAETTLTAGTTYTLTLTPTPSYPEIKEWALNSSETGVPMTEVEGLVDGSTGLIDNDNINLQDLFSRVELVLMGGTP